jgi:hypothetical protein
MITDINKDNLQNKSKDELIEIINYLKLHNSNNNIYQYIKFHDNLELNTNEELLNYIIKLNDRIDILEKKIDILQIENIKFKNENIKFKNENIKLSDRITVLENEKLYKKYIYSIQDLNAVDNLEITFKNHFSKFIKKLRVKRVDECHFILKKDSDNLKQYKKFIIKQKLNSIPSNFINILDNKYGNGLYDEINKHLNNLNISFDITLLTEDEIVEVEEWWDDDI